MSEFRQTASSAGLIGLTAFGGALVGFVLQTLVAFHFGAGADTDAYFMAISTSEMLSKLLLGGSITAVFLPIFVERLTRGQKHDAWQLALNIFHLTAITFVVLIALILSFTAPFVRFIAPGFDAATTELTINLLRVLLPSFMFLFLAELSTSMLHALKQFAIPAFLRVISPTVSIITILALVNTIGIYALALGTVIGSVIQFTFLLWGLRRNGLHYRFIFSPLDPIIKRLVYLVYPFILSVLVTQGAGIVYRILVSDLTTGSLASLKFAEKITQLLGIMFLASVTLVIFPIMSEKAAAKNFVGIRDTMGSAIRLITFLTLPIIIGVALLRDPLIALVYQRGSFSAEDASMTSIALLFLVLGMTINGISSVFGHAVLALQQTRAAVAVSISSQAVAIALFVMLVPHLQHAGLALASALVPISTTTLYYLYLTRYLPDLSRIFKHATYFKTIVLTFVLALVVIFTLTQTQRVDLDGTSAALFQLIISTIAGAGVFLIGAHLWKVPEMLELLAIVQGKINKWRGQSPVQS